MNKSILGQIVTKSNISQKLGRKYQDCEGEITEDELGIRLEPRMVKLKQLLSEIAEDKWRKL